MKAINSHDKNSKQKIIYWKRMPKDGIPDCSINIAFKELTYSVLKWQLFVKTSDVINFNVKSYGNDIHVCDIT